MRVNTERPTNDKSAVGNVVGLASGKLLQLGIHIQWPHRKIDDLVFRKSDIQLDRLWAAKPYDVRLGSRDGKSRKKL